jgi:hypothetical protein
MGMKEQIDELINRLKEKEYPYASHSGSGIDKMKVISGYRPAEETAIRQVVAEWLADYYQAGSVELETLKAKLAIYEEIVKKSNFAPMIPEPPKD